MLTLPNLLTYKPKVGGTAARCVEYCLDRYDLKKRPYTYELSLVEIFGCKEGLSSALGPDFDLTYPNLQQRACIAVMVCRVINADCTLRTYKQGSFYTDIDLPYLSNPHISDSEGDYVEDRSWWQILHGLHVVENFHGRLKDFEISKLPELQVPERFQSQYIKFREHSFRVSQTILDIRDPSSWHPELLRKSAR